MRDRLQSMYRVEERPDARFADLLDRLDEASARDQVSAEAWSGARAGKAPTLERPYRRRDS
jgi:hypothetical protein